MRSNVSNGIEANADRKTAVKQARDLKAAEQVAQLRNITLGQSFERWRSVDLKPQLRADGKRSGRKDGGKYVAEQFERHVFPRLGDLPLHIITKRDVLEILDGLKAQGKLRTANVVLADLKQLFRFAADRELIEVSAIERITKSAIGGSDVERERHLSFDEIALLANQLPTANLSRRSELAVWAILATGCRVGELMGATVLRGPNKALAVRGACEVANVKYGTVDLSKGTWYLPDTKNQRDHTIHLSTFARTVFSELIDLSFGTSWIFPNAHGSAPVDVKTFGKQLADRQRPTGKRLSNRAKGTQDLALPGGNWTAHDLRRTAATIMARLGISSDVINECLNHKSADRMTRVYVRDRRETEQRVAFDALGQKLAELHGAQTANALEASTHTPVVPAH